MNTDTIVVFGAGATKACGGPLTAEILPQAFVPNVRKAIQRQDYMKLLDDFLGTKDLKATSRRSEVHR